MSKSSKNGVSACHICSQLGECSHAPGQADDNRCLTSVALDKRGEAGHQACLLKQMKMSEYNRVGTCKVSLSVLGKRCMPRPASTRVWWRREAGYMGS